MSFLKKSLENEEIDTSSDREELYEKLFSKIGRDFVYTEDFVQVITEILNIIDPLQLAQINPQNKSGALRKALEYRAILRSGREGKSIYKDLINMDE